VKVFKNLTDSSRVRYYFSKRSKNLELIAIEEKRQGKIIWIYNFHFIDGVLTMLNKWNGIPARLKNSATSYYYLSNNELVHKEENNTRIGDIHYQINRAEEYKRKASTY
jgi:hypothetical protein